MDLPHKDIEAWNKSREDGKRAIGALALWSARDHTTAGSISDLLHEYTRHDEMELAIGSPNSHHRMYHRGYARHVLEQLEGLHGEMTKLVPALLKPSLHCQYLYLIFKDTKKKPDPERGWVLKAVAALDKPLELLEEKRRHYKGTSGFGSVVLYLEILLGDFLAKAAASVRASHHHTHMKPFAGMEGDMGEICLRAQSVQGCLDHDDLPAGDYGDVKCIVEGTTWSREVVDRRYVEVYGRAKQLGG
ncbi:MAG: hypothetical protein Q9170_002920 [Blastenia crenularia]